MSTETFVPSMKKEAISLDPLGLAFAASMPSLERRIAGSALEYSARGGLGLPRKPNKVWDLAERIVNRIDRMKPGKMKTFWDKGMRESIGTVTLMPTRTGMDAGKALSAMFGALDKEVKEDAASLFGDDPAAAVKLMTKYQPLTNEFKRLSARIPQDKKISVREAVQKLKYVNDKLDQAEAGAKYVKDNALPLGVGAATMTGVGYLAKQKYDVAHQPLSDAAEFGMPDVYNDYPKVAALGMVGEKKPEPPKLLDKKHKSPHKRLINKAIKANTNSAVPNVDLLITYTKKNGQKAQRMIRPVTTKGDLIIARDHMRDGQYRSFKLENIHTLEKAAMHQAFINGFEKVSRELTSKGRNRIADENFALPGRRYPIHDASHARNALARVAQHGTDAEKKQVRAAVHAKYPGIGE